MPPVLRLLLPLLLLGATAGCGDDTADRGAEATDDPTPSTAAQSDPAQSDPAVGAYDFTTTNTRSTIEQNPAGPRSTVTNVVYVTCWDEACDSLAQRASADMWHAQTFRLVPDGDSYTSTRERTGPCNDGTDREFRETFTLRWTLAEKGTLEGKAVQEFLGCEDRKVRFARYAVSGKPRPGQAPYLEASRAADLADVLNAYDESFSTVSDAFSGCFENDADAVEAARCKAEVYAPWLAGMKELATALPGFEGDSTGACTKTLEGTDVEGGADALGKAVTANRRVTNASTAKRAERPDKVGRDTALAMQTDLVQVATMCVPPQDYALLGEDGEMLIDAAGSLIPPLGPAE